MNKFPLNLPVKLNNFLNTLNILEIRYTASGNRLFFNYFKNLLKSGLK